jgi:hypothetical protein
MTFKNMYKDSNIKSCGYNEPVYCEDKLTENVSVWRCLNELHELLLMGSELQTGLVSAISPILELNPKECGASVIDNTSSGVELVDKIHGLMELARDNNQRMSEVIKAVRL